jgi:IS30 family transposase
MYTHITRDDRAVIADGLRRGESYATIGGRIGKDKGTVWREVHRNQEQNGTYHARRAHRRARERRAAAKHSERLLENHAHLALVTEALLDPLVSPEVVAHLLDIHHQSIYTWLYRSRPDLTVRLPYQGKKRRRYGTKRAQKQGWTRDVRHISERPTDRSVWEGDTIRGMGKARLLTHVEQASLFVRVDPLPNGTADAVHAVLKDNPLPGTYTYDRGSEFALWRMIENDTESAVYFADPHHPWQRGANENTNGRLRRVYPKRTDFSTIPRQELADVVALMNHTPRKSRDWRTPAELWEERRCS